eukprot:TRINITY_DN322_c1_g1_i1.p1 TRINITY_DN322_c1_g1~~TRINITY_DN322_c1_g1_i1.p1  ORF type:complete len:184 (+),score=113.50 TRINITY_DN322_c1_g1_i1:55-606(+)
MTEIEKKPVDEPTVEEVKDDSDDEVPELEAAGAVNAAAAPQPEVRQATRSEKKSKKAMAKLGLKPFEGCVKVTLRRSKTVNFVIDKPEVFYSGNTYVVFGMAKIDDVSGAKEAELMKAFQAAKAGMDAAPKEEGEEEEVDAEGVEEKDIEILMSQVTCTRNEAITALKKNNNDIVKTIMELNN